MECSRLRSIDFLAKNGAHDDIIAQACSADDAFCILIRPRKRSGGGSQKNLGPSNQTNKNRQTCISWRSVKIGCRIRGHSMDAFACDSPIHLFPSCQHQQVSRCWNCVNRILNVDWIRKEENVVSFSLPVCL